MGSGERGKFKKFEYFLTKNRKPRASGASGDTHTRVMSSRESRIRRPSVKTGEAREAAGAGGGQGVDDVKWTAEGAVGVPGGGAARERAGGRVAGGRRREHGAGRALGCISWYGAAKFFRWRHDRTF